MKSRRLVGGLAALAVAMGGPALIATAAPANAGSVTSPSFSSDPDAVVTEKGSDGNVNMLKSKGASIPRPKGVDKDASPADVASAHMKNYAKTFGVDANELSVKSSSDLAGGNAVRFSQKIDDRPVLGGEVVASLDKQGGMEFAVGETARGAADLEFPTVSDSAQEGMEETAKNIVKVREHLENTDGLEVSVEGEQWFDPEIVGASKEHDVTPTVTYEVSKDNADFRYEVIVNAETGRVQLAGNMIKNAQDRMVCDGEGENISQGDPESYDCGTTFDVTRGEGDPESGVPQVDQLYKWMDDTSKRYASAVNLDLTQLIGTAPGGENSPKSLRGTVNLCNPDEGGCPWANAFWDGNQAVFGNGLFSDDIAAHELSHGVTEQTAGLLYYYQSGAINEGLSDIWGELVDQHNGDDDDTPENAWLIGEGNDGGAIRNMADPTSPPNGDDPHPDSMTSPYWNAESADSEFWDSGGVHSNSGVLNKWGYLLGQPGDQVTNFNGYDVRSIGPTKLAKVTFSLQNLLTPGADYKDVYSVAQTACEKNIDAPGSFITADDCAQVEAAAKATEMYEDPSANSPVNAPYCDDGKQQTFEGEQFDGKRARWQPTGGFGFGKYGYSTTSDQSAFAEGSGTFTQMDAVDIPEDAYLRIDQSNYPGSDMSFGEASLEYSTDGGSSWEDASSLPNDNGGPWTEDTYGFASGRWDLSSLAGESVQLRLKHEGNDSYWFVDNIRFYTCSS